MSKVGAVDSRVIQLFGRTITIAGRPESEGKWANSIPNMEPQIEEKRIKEAGLCAVMKGSYQKNRKEHSLVIGKKRNVETASKLPACPRCGCEDTKFCYYSNYSINQPRCFCKNCKRHFTAGGVARDVLPMGSGKRKSENSTALDHHSTRCSHVGLSDSPSHDNKRMVSAAEDAGHGCSIPPSFVHDKLELTTVGSNGNGLNPSCASSATVPERLVGNDASLCKVKTEKNASGDHCVSLKERSHPVQNSLRHSWAFPWTPPGWDHVNMIQEAGIFAHDMFYRQIERFTPTPFAWAQSPIVPTPIFAVPTIQYPWFPASVWGCNPNCADEFWNNTSACNGDVPDYQSCNLAVGKHAGKSLLFPKKPRTQATDGARKNSEGI